LYHHVLSLVKEYPLTDFSSSKIKEVSRKAERSLALVGENFLDPFCGPGTRRKAARQLRRNSVGIEIYPELEAVIRGAESWTRHSSN
jgi:DNA modification methylase